MICTEPDLSSQQTFRSQRPRLIYPTLFLSFSCTLLLCGGIGSEILVAHKRPKSPTHLHLTCRLPEGALFEALPIER
jgi:hypothetical protein